MGKNDFGYRTPPGVAHAITNADTHTAYPSTLARFAQTCKLGVQAAAFAPMRLGNDVKSFTTGDAYFKNVCAAIQGAKRSVFIAGWQVNWAVELIPGVRLIDALKSAVDNDAKVYVMPWMSPKVGVNTGDLGTMLAVFQLNAGRKGFPAKGFPAKCCPAGLQNDYKDIEETFFSHHQKLVVIDNKIAYVGGIDLAFGRRDDARFSLAHEGRTGPEVYNTGVPPAIPLGVAAMTAYLTESELLQTTLSAGMLNELAQGQQGLKKTVGKSRMGKTVDSALAWWRESELPPWIQEPVDGLSNAVQTRLDTLSNTLTDELIEKLDQNLIQPGDVEPLLRAVGDFTQTAYLTLIAATWVQHKPNAELFKPRVQSAPLDAVYRIDQPRMPWQDVQVRIEGPSVYDLSMNFIRRWDSLQQSYLPVHLAPLAKVDSALLPVKPTDGKGNGGVDKVGVRVLRSASLTLQEDEVKGTKGLAAPTAAQCEIHNAMVSLIDNAEKFIYIENQFFQSAFGTPSIKPEDAAARSGALNYVNAHPVNRLKAALTRAGAAHLNTAPNNGIAAALARRIEQAIRWGHNFHVYLVLPIHPEGSLADAAIIGQIHWTMQSLVFASDSLINQIRVAIRAKQLCKQPRDNGQWAEAKKKAGEYDAQKKKLGYEFIDFEETYPYLTLLNLRSCQTIGGKVRTEQVYVHSKLLIVDDRFVILGSANINDRSLGGGRDSELAVQLMDTATQDAPLDGKHPVKVRTLAHQLRVDLWKKHFALNGANDIVQPAASLAAMVDKPADPKTWQAMQAIANENLAVYAKAFPWTPRDQASIWPVWDKKVKIPRNAKGEVEYAVAEQIGQPFHDHMPFSEAFWKSAPVAAKPSGIKGFICALPMRWTEGENNHPGMNMILLTEQRIPGGAGPRQPGDTMQANANDAQQHGDSLG